MLIKISILAFVITTNAYAWGLKELGDEAAVPVTTDARPMFIAGSLLSLGFVVFEDQMGDPFDDKQVRNQTLGDSSRFGDVLGQLIPNALYIGGMAYSGMNGNELSRQRATGMFKATAYSGAVANVLKYTIREPRPNDHSIRNSFPSGHTTTSFAFSGYVTAEHGWVWGSASLLLSSFIAYSRINDGAHRLHDVIAGATLGWAYGWGMSKHQKNSRDAIAVLPMLDTKTAGLSLYKEF